jgi:hypothetical protein
VRRVKVVKAAAGIGKTTLAAEAVANSVGGITEVYVPTHRLGGEWTREILKNNPRKRVINIAGRSFSEPGGRPMCRKHKVAEELAARGAPVFPHLCYRERRGQSPVKCKYYDECPYISQFAAADVYVYTHAHLTLPRTVLEGWTPRSVIIDEAFFQSCIGKATIPLAQLRSSMIPAGAQDICCAIADIFDERLPLLPTLEARIEMEQHRSARDAIRKAAAAVDPSMALRDQKRIVSDTVSMEPARALIDVLFRDRLGPRKQSQAVTYDRNTAELGIHWRKPITRWDSPEHGVAKNSADPQISIIDASASREIISRFFEIASFHSIEAPRKAHVRQCFSTRCSTTSVVPRRNKAPRSRRDARRRLDDINTLISRMAGGNRRVLVVGPQAVVGNPKNGKNSLIKVPPHGGRVHFNGLRGSDEWKDFDAVVIIGRNEPPVVAVEELGRAVFFDDEQDLLLSGEWGLAKRGYRIPGKKYGVDTTVHPDARVQAIVEQLRECESEQAIDRLRLVHAEKTKDVVILSNLPINIDVHELMSWDDITKGSRLQRAFLELDGVMPLRPGWLSKRFSRLWKSEAAAKADVLNACKKAGFPNIDTISKTSLSEFKFKTTGQRRWSRCLSIYEELARTAAELEHLLGERVSVRP